MSLPTLGLRLEKGRRICFTVPAGSSIFCTSGPFTRTGLIDVTCNGIAAEMFVVDVRTRGTLIKVALLMQSRSRKRSGLAAALLGPMLLVAASPSNFLWRMLKSPTAFTQLGRLPNRDIYFTFRFRSALFTGLRLTGIASSSDGCEHVRHAMAARLPVSS